MPFLSSYPSFTIPDISLWSLLFERTRDSHTRSPTRMFQDAVTGQSYDLHGLKEACIKFSSCLQNSFSVKKGDAIAVFGQNNIDYPIACLGTLRVGAIFAPASAASTAAELAWQLKDSGASVLVTTSKCLTVAQEAVEQAGISKDRLLLIGDDALADPKHFKNLLTQSEGPNKVFVTGSDLAVRPYSSGTTGKPKGVDLTHRNLVSCIMANDIADTEDPPGVVNAKERILAFLPFSHIYGISLLILQPIYEAREIVIMDKFDLDLFCGCVQRYGITYSYVVPPILVLLAKHPAISRYDLSSLRGFMSAAAPLTAELIGSVYDRLRIPVKQGYGLSETSPTIMIQPWSRWKARGSVGILSPNLTVKWMSDSKEAPAGTVGELWVKGPNIFHGYHDRPEATKDSFHDGWFRTGDVGYQDDNGNCYITDRVKELIKYKGFQVAPAELEGKLLGHEAVADVAVLGQYDENQASEVPLAFIAPVSTVVPDAALAAEIIAWLDGQVSPYKRLRGGVRWVDAIPKSPTGKILRRMLRDKYRVSSQPQRAKL